ncbi:hypothetical protein K7432_001380 [Basidiobolus ranarum]|uniref:Uncharacterized protein n=1 Tax=Basidiobolus ranarum TaxID=34480 RepID=A0ABR2X345_9FUNG
MGQNLPFYTGFQSTGNRSQIPLAEAMRMISHARTTQRTLAAETSGNRLAEAMRGINSTRRREALHRTQNVVTNTNSNSVETRRVSNTSTTNSSSALNQHEQLPTYDSLQLPAYESPPPYCQ